MKVKPSVKPICEKCKEPNCQPVAFQNGSSICRASSSVIS